MLFQTLATSILGGKGSRQNDPLLSLFCAGDFIKEVMCEECEKERRGASKTIVENPLMLDVHEDLYDSGKKMENFFQEDYEQRKCDICQKMTKHSKKVCFTALPEIFALRIAENSAKEPDEKECKTRLELSFCNKGTMKKYEFISGVYNMNRGFDGYHSIAYVKKDDVKEGEEARFWVYNDRRVGVVGYDEIRQYPKLLFYRQVRDNVENN
mgnify:CR=1 FL=1